MFPVSLQKRDKTITNFKNCYYGYGRRDVNGKANAGLTLGIIGTALGAWALFGNRRSSGLLGLAGLRM